MAVPTDTDTPADPSATLWSAALGVLVLGTVSTLSAGITLLLALLVMSLRRSEVRAREHAHRLTESLREAQRERECIIDSAADGILTLDENGMLLTFNRAAVRMFGYAAREVLGHKVDKLLPAPFHALCQEALALPQASSDGCLPAGLRCEIAGHRRSGEEFLAQVTWNVTVIAGKPRIVVLICDISERKRNERRIQHIAHHDALTGLPNRHLLTDRIEMAMKQARRDSDRAAVLMIDLDHFKHINDSLGHQAGDQVLLAVAERLSGCVRACDTVVRMGGDEFLVVLPHVPDRNVVNRAAESIVRQISMPIAVGKVELHVTPSVGISWFPDDDEDVQTLLKNADTAMYHAKAKGRANHQWFTNEMRQEAQGRLAMGNDMRRALERHEFSLVYQPQVAAQDGRLIGMEALARWQHPQHGLLMPDQFIPVAEDSGLIVPLGEWVLRRACIDAEQVRRQTGRALNVAVNVSPRQLQQKDFLHTVRASLHDSGLPPDALTLEITESILADTSDEAMQLLRDLRAMGVSVAIDDFGTGYSSLSYVTRFPLSKIKIDRSFVSRIPGSAPDEAVATAVMAVARSLKIEVLAEGVETLEQLEFLRQYGCSEAQGYLFSEPVTLAGFFKTARLESLTSTSAESAALAPMHPVTH